jgi:hypothetical protein
MKERSEDVMGLDAERCICRLGFLDVVLSRPLLRGFITAVGIIILIEQVS